MKKILFILFIIVAIGFFCFIHESSVKAEETKTFVGTIKSFAYGFGFRSGPPLWPLGMIEVVADNGQKNNFLFVGSGRPSATIFYDIDGKNLGMVTEGLSKTEAAKKVGIGKKVEVTYTTSQETARFIHRNLAIAVRYVAANYVPQSTVPSAQVGSNPASYVTAAEAKIFIGAVKDVTAVLGREPNWTYNKINVSADNGDKADFFVMRRTVITDSGGSDLSGKRIQKGKRVEIKYSTLTDSSYIINGQKGADSIRYVATDYVPQPTTTNQPNLAAQAAIQNKNTVIGKVKDITGIAPGLINNWAYAKILIVADGGNESAFFINTKTALINEKGVTNPPLPKKDQRVELKYSIGGDGRNEAISIHYVLSDYNPKLPAPAVSAQNPAATTAGQGNIFIGKVEKITPTRHHADMLQPRSRILVVADNGEQLEFFVPGTCPVSDAAGNNMSNSSYHGSLLLKKGQRIEVRHSVITNGNIITNGHEGAESIRCLD